MRYDWTSENGKLVAIIEIVAQSVTEVIHDWAYSEDGELIQVFEVAE